MKVRGERVGMQGRVFRGEGGYAGEGIQGRGWVCRGESGYAGERVGMQEREWVCRGREERVFRGGLGDGSSLISQGVWSTIKLTFLCKYQISEHQMDHLAWAHGALSMGTWTT